MAIGVYSINGYQCLFYYKLLLVIMGYIMIIDDYYNKLLLDILCYNIIGYQQLSYCKVFKLFLQVIIFILNYYTWNKVVYNKIE